MQIREDIPAAPSTDLGAVYRMHAELCKALANEHRQAILHALGDGEKCVGDLAAEIGISVHNVSQHLRVLKERRLVASRKEGQTVYYRVTNQKFIQACALIRQALVEEHLAQGESLHAAELLDSAAQQTGSEATATASPTTTPPATPPVPGSPAHASA
jgi:ArsR family transcriptional regulator, virulence genes transcriptional regulator